ncbi:hypothetical protein HanRHA438_Chr04g0198891 [Helianthus annuus]|nr:hypothetical protein HanRHA438_Chr04g0198891 [Helianthus annuus]
MKKKKKKKKKKNIIVVKNTKQIDKLYRFQVIVSKSNGKLF